ncbi:NAD(P)-dependent oxidoreductase [Chloroflexota bacterium]
MMKTKVGYIGLGDIGEGMAKNLARTGYGLTIKSPRSLQGKAREEFIKEFQQLGSVKAVSTCKEVAANSDIVFSAVRDDAETHEVMWGEDGVLAGITSGSIIVIISTVSPAICQKLAQDGSKMDVAVIDAPVSGGHAGARDGTLTLIVGGQRNAFDRIEPVLKTVGKNIFYLGDVGMGQIAKLTNQMMLGCNEMAAAEALSFAVKAGIPLETIFDVIKVSSGRSWAIENWERFLRPPTLVRKDCNLAVEYANGIGAKLPLTSLVTQLDVHELLR